MRLLVITNDFPNAYDPTKAVFNLNLARALAVHHEVAVVSPISWLDEWKARRRGAGPLPDRRILVDGIEVHYPRYYYPPRTLRSTYGWWYWRSVRGTVRRIVEERPPDAVLGYWLHPDGRAAVRAARICGVPSAVIVGGSDLLLLPNDRLRRRQVLAVLQDADALIAVNQHLKDVILGYGIPSSKVHSRQQGVDVDQFHPGDRTEARTRLGIPVEGRVLVWVGRMVPVKGLDILLQACARLRDAATPFHLYLVGDGPLRGELEADVAQLGLAGIVTFLGSRSPNQLPDWYRAADLTVLPSRSEGLPNVLRESLACGTPFVASCVGGISEISEPPLDRLVPPNDPPALAAAIAQMLLEPSVRLRTKFHAQSWQESAESMVQILETLKAQFDERRSSMRVSHAVGR